MADGGRIGSITLLDVAKAAGVSRTTVSNAFNRPDQLSADLRTRILEIARDLGYPGPNPIARMLRTGQAGAIGIVFPDELTYAFNDAAAIAFLQGVSTACERQEAGLLILPGAAAETAEMLARTSAVDGFVVFGLPAGSSLVKAIRDRALPTVTVDQPPIPGAAAIGIDDRAAAREAARYLLGLGHRSIGIVAFEFDLDGFRGPVTPARRAAGTFQTTIERARGYADAFAAAGIAFDSVPMEERPGNTADAGHDAARALLARNPRPTAILAMSDMLALGALRAADECGFRVPGDLSVVGFDDIPLARQIVPALTTIHQPLSEKGERAAAILFDAGQAARAPRIVLPTELVVRQSTAPPPGEPGSCAATD